jgi:WD40 repeat protein
MIEGIVRAQSALATLKGPSFRAAGRPVKLAVLSWPVVIFLGATVAAATCLLKDCEHGVAAEPRDTLWANAATIKALAIRPDGAMLGAVSIDDSIALWNLGGSADSAPPPPRVSDLVRSLAFDAKSRFLATAGPEGPAKLYDLATHESRILDDVASSSAGAACLAFAPDGATLAIGQQDGLITFWTVTSGRRLRVLGGHDDFVASLAFAPDGATAASSGGDRSVRIWDVPLGRQRVAIRSQTSTYVALTFSPDGRLLVLGDQVSPVVRLWDTATGTERATLRGASGAVVSVAISPDGATLAAADYKGQITFWDLATLTTSQNRLWHPGTHSLAFAPDGRTLFTGGFDGAIHLWNRPRSRSW